MPTSSTPWIAVQGWRDERPRIGDQPEGAVEDRVAVVGPIGLPRRETRSVALAAG